MANREKLQGEITVEKLEGQPIGSPRRFRMKAYSGRPVERAYGRVVFDMEKCSIPQKLPILLNHDTSKVVGYADSFEKTADGLFLCGVICSTPEGDQVAKLSDEGFPLTSSIGIEADSDKTVEGLDKDKEAVVNGQTLKGPMRVWRGSHLFETSFITAGPADRSTSAVVLSDEERDVSKENEKLVADTKTAEREQMKQFEDAFPNRPGYGVKAYLAGKTLDQAKLEEKVLAAEERAKDAEEKLKAIQEKAAKQPTPQDRHPGIGFNGPEREGASQTPDFSNLEPEARAEAEWKAIPAVREAFSSQKTLAAFYRAEERGFKNAGNLEIAAEALVRNSVGE